MKTQTTQTIYGCFAEQVARRPDAPAVITRARTLTYAELDRMISAIATMLPRNPRFVGIVMDHGPAMIAAMLAVLKTGAAYVPAEPSFPVDRIRFMLTEADVDVVVTQREYDGLFRGAERIYIAPDFSDTPVPQPIPVGTATEDLAYVLYTSGTTGDPKGVCVENRNVLGYVKAFEHEMRIGPGDVMLQHSVCSFDIFVEEVFCSLLTGAALAIPSIAEHDNVPALLDFVDEMGVTIVDGFPYLIADFNASGRVPKGVRLYISGGDVLRANYCDQLVDRAEVYNTYGPSETTCCATYYRASAGAPLADGTYPVGRAVLGYRVDILNEDLQPVDRGQVGEICVTGTGVSRGYLTQRPESSNFVMQDDGSRMYRTGDLGVMTDTGDIAFLRRKDSQVMIEGKRVECTEVENVLSADDSVDRAVVRDHSDENGLSYLVAYLTPASQSIVLSELRKRLARRLTSFMIPEFFVVMNEIPLNSNGKPDDAALPVVLKAG
ncbi:MULTISPECIES: amino acid adenylation domain-containing protein [unclassified Actinomyces]|uniref:amino acid adenylation domain-containing protein n=1 Tax=unclassified Actinomyces TaxID=2609248 RepID=UPI000D59EB36|nr:MULTISPECIES: amino acid adenylation domain-containing protein [unclassified Actinomyces]RAX23083.1 amino acid adenylation domain-containing protein [Actinomyces sp. Z3]